MKVPWVNAGSSTSPCCCDCPTCGLVPEATVVISGVVFGCGCQPGFVTHDIQVSGDINGVYVLPCMEDGFWYVDGPSITFNVYEPAGGCSVLVHSNTVVVGLFLYCGLDDDENVQWSLEAVTGDTWSFPESVHEEANAFWGYANGLIIPAQPCGGGGPGMRSNMASSGIVTVSWP